MRCPYCREAMEKGLIESSEPINFMKEVRFVNKANEKKGNSIWQSLLSEVVLSLKYGSAEAAGRS